MTRRFSVCEAKIKLAIMLATYEAILHDNQLEWQGEAPRPASARRVHVTILEETGANLQRGQEMAHALEDLARNAPLTPLDGETWQRELRGDISKLRQVLKR